MFVLSADFATGAVDQRSVDSAPQVTPEQGVSNIGPPAQQPTSNIGPDLGVSGKSPHKINVCVYH